MTYRRVVGARRCRGRDRHPCPGPCPAADAMFDEYPKGKQVYIPCDLLNARVKYPPGQRCIGPLDEYPRCARLVWLNVELPRSLT